MFQASQNTSRPLLAQPRTPPNPVTSQSPQVRVARPSTPSRLTPPRKPRTESSMEEGSALGRFAIAIRSPPARCPAARCEGRPYADPASPGRQLLPRHAADRPGSHKNRVKQGNQSATECVFGKGRRQQTQERPGRSRYEAYTRSFGGPPCGSAKISPGNGCARHRDYLARSCRRGVGKEGAPTAGTPGGHPVTGVRPEGGVARRVTDARVQSKV